MSSQLPSIDSALWALAQLARSQPDLAAEEPAARAEFFDLPTQPLPAPRDQLAEQRFLEWFLLERPSTTRSGVPVELLVAQAPDEDTSAAETLRERYPALRNSRVGVFQVTSIEAERGFWLRDLFGTGQYPVADPAAAVAMAEGDLIVGRLYPSEAEAEASFELSRCAGCFRNPDLAQAIELDLERLRQGRRGPLRMQQIELERMFFAPGSGHQAVGDPAAVIADARVLLEKNGLDPEAVELVFSELRAAPFEPTRWAHGTDDTLGRILDHLAFETEVDLEAARRALLAAWPALYASTADPAPSASGAGSAGPERPAPGALQQAPNVSADVQSALSSFEAGRAAGRDLEALFNELERDLGLEHEDDPDSGDLPDFPGVVGAMVEEFLWETSQQDDPDLAKRFEVLRAFSRFGTDIGVFENLDRSDIVRFVSFWLPESGELVTADELAALFDALEAFIEWARTSHQLDRLEDTQACLEETRRVLPRIQQLNQMLRAAHREAGPEAEAVGELLEILPSDGPVPPEHVDLSTLSGVELRARVLPAEVLDGLAPGDRLRAAVSDLGEAGTAAYVLRCYPASIAEIEQSLR